MARRTQRPQQLDFEADLAGPYKAELLLRRRVVWFYFLFAGFLLLGLLAVVGTAIWLATTKGDTFVLLSEGGIATLLTVLLYRTVDAILRCLR